jgi:hypothetical protein
VGLDPPHGEVGGPGHDAGAAAQVDGQLVLGDVDRDGLVLVRSAQCGRPAVGSATQASMAAWAASMDSNGPQWSNRSRRSVW